jgi:uncharacterized membrane protein
VESECRGMCRNPRAPQRGSEQFCHSGSAPYGDETALLIQVLGTDDSASVDSIVGVSALGKIAKHHRSQDVQACAVRRLATMPGAVSMMIDIRKCALWAATRKIAGAALPECTRREADHAREEGVKRRKALDDLVQCLLASDDMTQLSQVRDTEVLCRVAVESPVHQ